MLSRSEAMAPQRKSHVKPRKQQQSDRSEDWATLLARADRGELKKQAEKVLQALQHDIQRERQAERQAIVTRYRELMRSRSLAS